MSKKIKVKIVKIKTTERMIKEYGSLSRVPCGFIQRMEDVLPLNRIIKVAPVSAEGRYIWDKWLISEEMIEHHLGGEETCYSPRPVKTRFVKVVFDGAEYTKDKINDHTVPETEESLSSLIKARESLNQAISAARLKLKRHKRMLEKGELD